MVSKAHSLHKELCHPSSVELAVLFPRISLWLLPLLSIPLLHTVGSPEFLVMWATHSVISILSLAPQVFILGLHHRTIFLSLLYLLPVCDPIFSLPAFSLPSVSQDHYLVLDRRANIVGNICSANIPGLWFCTYTSHFTVPPFLVLKLPIEYECPKAL